MKPAPIGLGDLGVLASRDPNPRVRVLGAKLLGVVGGTETESVISKLLRDREPEVQVAAAGSILRRQFKIPSTTTPFELDLSQSTSDLINDSKNAAPN